MVDVLPVIVYKNGVTQTGTPLPRDAHFNLMEHTHMNVNLKQLKNLISKRSDEIEKSVAGTGYLAKTVIGVGTFLLDNEGDVDLLSPRQRLTFDRFIQPLLEKPRR